MSQHKSTRPPTAPSIRQRRKSMRATAARRNCVRPPATPTSSVKGTPISRLPAPRTDLHLAREPLARLRRTVLPGALLACSQPLRALPWRTIVGVLLAVITVVLGARALILAHDAATGTDAGVDGQSNAAPLVGHQAPDAIFLDLRNHQVRLSSFRGQVVVLNFWYANCPPCQSEMPALERTYQADTSHGLVVLGVDVSDDAPTISAFIQKLGITYPVVRDMGARAAGRYSLYATPSTFVIDRHGIIRVKVEGPVDEQTLGGELNGLLGKR